MSNVHTIIDSEFEGTDYKETRWDMAGERTARRVRKRERDQAGRGSGKEARWQRAKVGESGRG